MMKKISNNEFKEIAYNMLESFHELCKIHRLQYVLDYGTLLGAVRHNGFIPWDDDIDVTMPRCDYERLCSLASQKESIFGPNYRLSFPGSRFSVRKPMANLVDIRTIVESPNRQEKFFYPIWIDIFPMDFAPFGKQDVEQIYNKIQRQIWYTRKAMDRREGSHRIARSIFGDANIPLIQHRLKKADLLAKSFPANPKLISFMAPYGVKDIVNADYFDRPRTMKFENGLFMIPQEYDLRLKNLYGNYMELPSEENRIPHSTQAYWI